MAKRRRARRRGYSSPRIARGQYRYTPARQRALRKAQMVSARKRKGKGISRNTKIGIAAGVGTAAIVGTAVARHKLSGSEFSIKVRKATPSGVRHSTVSHKSGKEHPGYAFSHGGTHHSASGRELPSFNRHKIRVGIPAIGGMTLAYRHKGLTAAQAKEKLFGKKTPSGGAPPQARTIKRRPIDRDTIPYTSGSSKSWPHVGADIAREQNEGLREGTHYLGPTGVKRYPQNVKGQLAIDEKIFRRSMGLGWTQAGETNKMWAETVKGIPQRRRRRKRRKKK